jgi:excisionase family DNA binding protein
VTGEVLGLTEIVAKANNYVMPEMSTAEAARRLGVSRREVQRLARSGDLAATRTIGDAYVIDPLAANARARAEVERGRPWSPEVAWAALWLISGLEVTWLDYYQRRRLDQRLANITVDRLLAATRRRATVTRYRGARTALSEARRSVILSGISASGSLRTDLAADASLVDGYADESQSRALVRRWELAPDPEGTIVIRTTDVSDVLRRDSVMPTGVVAADLAGSNDVRERSAGRRALQAMLS